jgi:hypothetical protein
MMWAISIVGALWPSSAHGDVFGKRITYLREQIALQSGREPIVEGYEQLIEQFPDDPRVAEAMKEVAHLMELEIPEMGIRPDPVRALQWFRRAAANAVPGSKIWTEAHFHYARRLQSSPSEARRILEKIAENSQGDSVTLAEVEYDLLSVCVNEGDFEGAEAHCLRVLQLYDDPSRIPKDSLQKSQLDGFIRAAAAAMAHAWIHAPLAEAGTRRENP